MIWDLYLKFLYSSELQVFQNEFMRWKYYITSYIDNCMCTCYDQMNKLCNTVLLEIHL